MDQDWIKGETKSLRSLLPLSLALIRPFLLFYLTVLWHDGDELLHSPVRSVEGTGCAGTAHLEQSPRPTSREAQIHEHGRSDEAGGL